MNALIHAALVGDLDLARRALTSGIAVDAIDTEHGNTPLMIAAYNNHPEVVRFLIGAGADVNARCNASNTPLMKAAWGGSLESVEQILDAGADINAREAEGMTTMMLAAFYGRTEVVRMLLERGADPLLPDNDGYTALKNARKRRHQEIVALLLPYGGDEEEVEEVSMNFDSHQVRPFLEAIARSISAGFTETDACELADAIGGLQLDEERSWSYTVTYRRRAMALRIEAFMDDVDAPDIRVFAAASLASKIEKQLESFVQ